MTLSPIVDELFAAARKAGRCERREAYVADAIVEMARRARGEHAGKAPPTYTAVIRADLTALVNGRAAAGETCEIAGLGPVPVAVARRLFGDAVLKLVITRGVDVRNVTSLGRGPTAAQKVALLWEQPTARSSGADVAPDSRLTTSQALSSRRRSTPGSTSSTDCATSTTTRRPTTAGDSCPGQASDRWSRPTTAATPSTRRGAGRPSRSTHDFPPTVN